MNAHEARSRLAALRDEARAINASAGEAALTADQESRFAAIEAEVATLQTAERRAAMLDDMDRRSAGTHVGADPAFDRLTAGVGLLDAVRAQLGGTDATAGRAREASQEMERRSGRRAQGLFWNMGAEQRTVTPSLPAGGPGSNVIGQDYRPELFIDRLRNATRVRQLGATVLSGLVGNVVIPRLKSSVVAGWAADNTALSLSDPSFDGVTLSPRSAGCITEFSRQMVLQASPDVETLARNDMSKVLAELLDAAAIAGMGGVQPLGILNTAGIGLVSMGTNGGALTYDAVADVMGAVADANGQGTGYLTNTKVRRAAAKLKDTTGEPLGLDVVFQGQPVAYSNLMPSAGAKGTGTNLSSLIYGAWSDLLIGVWSELDILVNPFGDAYSRGGVQIRAMMTMDVAVRHAASFAAITDLVA